MKIYPATQKLNIKKQISFEDIPLAYVEKRYGDFNCQLRINNEFSKNRKTTYVKPYQQISGTKALFFDENEEAITDSEKYLKRVGDDAIIMPINSSEFVPDTFTYSIVMNNVDKFKYNVDYNLNVYASNTDIAQKLIPALSNPAMYGICPTNITINNNEIIPQTTAVENTNKADCYFVNTADIADKTKLNNLIAKHNNVWIFGDSFDTLMSQSSDTNDAIYQLDNYQIYTDEPRTMDGYKTTDNKYIVFNKNGTWNMLSNTEYEYLDMFLVGNPILVARKIGGGYVILSHSSFLTNIAKYTELLFEVLMYIYLNGYFQTEQKTSFITDKNIDYFVNMNQRYFYKHPRINLKQLLYECGHNNAVQCNIFDVKCSTNVSYFGINKYDDLIFNKIDHLNDPTKSSDDISIYTTKNTVVICKKIDNRIRMIEDPFNINYNIEENKITIDIMPMLSSHYDIDFKRKQHLEITDIGSFYIVYDKINNEFKLKLQNLYAVEDGPYFATINITRNDNIDYVDIRQLGGGDKSKTNYEMIDTGNIKGRPYRIGNIMLIRLPKRFENIDSDVKNELNKHIASGDYPIIIYE